MKATVVGFLITALAFGAIGVGLNVWAAGAVLSQDLMVSGAFTGGIVSLGAVLFALVLGGNTPASGLFPLGAALASGGIYYWLSLQEFGTGDWMGTAIAAGIGLVAGSVGRFFARIT